MYFFNYVQIIQVEIETLYKRISSRKYLFRNRNDIGIVLQSFHSGIRAGTQLVNCVPDYL